MPHFRVILHGKGICVPQSDGDGAPVQGFFTTRAVTAADANSAIRMAADLIRAEWTTGSYASSNQGAVPTLTPEKVFEVSILIHWLRQPKGYTFYAGDDENEDAQSPPPNTSLERTRGR
jgi:hypothetical protein